MIALKQDDAPPPSDPQNEPNDRATVLAGLVVVVLVVGGWFLVQRMIADAKIQDCVMSGRHNCAPIDTSKLPR